MSSELRSKAGFIPVTKHARSRGFQRFGIFEKDFQEWANRHIRQATLRVVAKEGLLHVNEVDEVVIVTDTRNTTIITCYSQSSDRYKNVDILRKERVGESRIYESFERRKKEYMNYEKEIIKRENDRLLKEKHIHLNVMAGEIARLDEMILEMDWPHTRSKLIAKRRALEVEVKERHNVVNSELRAVASLAKDLKLKLPDWAQLKKEMLSESDERGVKDGRND